MIHSSRARRLALLAAALTGCGAETTSVPLDAPVDAPAPREHP